MAAGKPDTLPAVYWRGQWSGAARTTQFIRLNSRLPRRVRNPNDAPATLAPTTPRRRAPPRRRADRPISPPRGQAPPRPQPPRRGRASAVPASSPPARDGFAFSRAASDVPMQCDGWHETTPGSNQWVGVISSGVTVVVDGLGDYGTIDLSTDRLVIWMTGSPFEMNSATLQDERVPLEFYMEGPHRIPPGRTHHQRRPDVLRRVEPRRHGVERRPSHSGADLRRAVASARRRDSANCPGPLLRPKRLPHVEPDGRPRLSAPGRRHLLPRHSAADDRFRRPANRCSIPRRAHRSWTISDWPHRRTTSCSSGRRRCSTGR